MSNVIKKSYLQYRLIVQTNCKIQLNYIKNLIKTKLYVNLENRWNPAGGDAGTGRRRARQH